MKKRTYYVAQSEFGEKKFFSYKRFLDFMWVYIPRWSHKITPYKVVGGLRYKGQYVQNNRHPIHFRIY